MYFEPTNKKTYYRFPSTSNKADLDFKFYYPEKNNVMADYDVYQDYAVYDKSFARKQSLSMK